MRAFIWVLDIVNYSSLWDTQQKSFYEELCKQLPILLESHNIMAPIIYNSTGDGFLLALPSANRAENIITTAFELQKGLLDPSIGAIQTRQAIGYGECIEVKSYSGKDDVVGKVVNETSRICALGDEKHLLTSSSLRDTFPGAFQDQKWELKEYKDIELRHIQGTKTVLSIYIKDDDLGNFNIPTSINDQNRLSSFHSLGILESVHERDIASRFPWSKVIKIGGPIEIFFCATSGRNIWNQALKYLQDALQAGSSVDILCSDPESIILETEEVSGRRTILGPLCRHTNNARYKEEVEDGMKGAGELKRQFPNNVDVRVTKTCLPCAYIRIEGESYAHVQYTPYIVDGGMQNRPVFLLEKDSHIDRMIFSGLQNVWEDKKGHYATSKK